MHWDILLTHKVSFNSNNTKICNKVSFNTNNIMKRKQETFPILELG